MPVSPVFNGSSTLEHFKRNNTLEICNGVVSTRDCHTNSSHIHVYQQCIVSTTSNLRNNVYPGSTTSNLRNNVYPGSTTSNLRHRTNIQVKNTVEGRGSHLESIVEVLFPEDNPEVFLDHSCVELAAED